jgi:Protein of unknown function (DUF3667)
MAMGAPELDAATADAIVGEFGRASRHSLPLGTPCPNCATPLQGPWCHVCGQKGEAYSRSIRHLTTEAFEGLTHFDGRFWQTLPRLAFKPGQLTRDYLDGHRAAQIPPFRLFLVVLLLVFFAGGLNLGQSHHAVKLKSIDDPKVQDQLNWSAEDKADFAEAMGNIKTAAVDPKNPRIHTVFGPNDFWSERAKKAMANPEMLVLAMEQWGHRFAVLMLPLAALLLSVLFVFKRGVYVFDHLIFSMHSLSFQGLLVTICFLGGLGIGWIWQLLWLAPVHLFVHMRGTYRTSVAGTLLRMTLLFFGSSVVVAVLLAALVVVGVATMH